MRLFLTLLLCIGAWADPIRQSCGSGVFLEFPAKPKLWIKRGEPNHISYSCTYQGGRYWMTSFPCTFESEKQGMQNLDSNLAEFGRVPKQKMRKGRFYGYRFTTPDQHVLWLLDNKRWVQVWAPANASGTRFLDSLGLP